MITSDIGVCVVIGNLNVIQFTTN